MNNIGQSEHCAGTTGCIDVCNETYLAGDFCSGPFWNGDAFYTGSSLSMSMAVLGTWPGPYSDMAVVINLPGTQGSLTLDISAGSNNLTTTIPANATTFVYSWTITDSPENWAGYFYVALSSNPGTWELDQVILHNGSYVPCLE